MSYGEGGGSGQEGSASGSGAGEAAGTAGSLKAESASGSGTGSGSASGQSAGTASGQANASAQKEAKTQASSGTPPAALSGTGPQSTAASTAISKTNEVLNGQMQGPVTPSNQKQTEKARQKNISNSNADESIVGEVQPLQEGRADDSEDLAEPLKSDVRESEKEREMLDENENMNPVREWLLQEKLLLHELKKFKPVRQPNDQNPPWEYYLMRQKQLVNEMKQIRRRIEFTGKRDEFFIEMRHLSEIANRLLALLNRGEFTDYKAAGKAYDSLLSELELVKLTPETPEKKDIPTTAGEEEQLPENYRGAISQYFQRLSEE